MKLKPFTQRSFKLKSIDVCDRVGIRSLAPKNTQTESPHFELQPKRAAGYVSTKFRPLSDCGLFLKLTAITAPLLPSLFLRSSTGKFIARPPSTSLISELNPTKANGNRAELARRFGYRLAAGNTFGF